MRILGELFYIAGSVVVFGALSVFFSIFVASYLAPGKFDYDNNKIWKAIIFSGVFWFFIYETMKLASRSPVDANLFGP